MTESDPGISSPIDPDVPPHERHHSLEHVAGLRG
jgi:hypothetical protein